MRKLLLACLILSATSLCAQVRIPGPGGATAAASAPTTGTPCDAPVTGSSTALSCGSFVVSASATGGMVAIVGGLSTTVSSVAWVGSVGGSATMTQCKTVDSGAERLFLYTVSSPPTGNVTVTVNTGSTTLGYKVIPILGGSGTSSACPNGTFASSGTATITVSSATNHLVVDFISRDMGTCSAATPTATGQTAIGSSICTNGQFAIDASFTPGAASVSPTWTFASQPWGQLGVSWQ